KGRKLLASAVWLDALTNGMGPREAAENWDLPLEACEEIFAYCETNKALIEAEANEERQRLKRANGDVDSRAPALKIRLMKTRRLARNSTFCAVPDTMCWPSANLIRMGRQTRKYSSSPNRSSACC